MNGIIVAGIDMQFSWPVFFQAITKASAWDQCFCHPGMLQRSPCLGHWTKAIAISNSSILGYMNTFKRKLILSWNSSNHFESGFIPRNIIVISSHLWRMSHHHHQPHHTVPKKTWSGLPKNPTRNFDRQESTNGGRFKLAALWGWFFDLFM